MADKFNDLGALHYKKTITLREMHDNNVRNAAIEEAAEKADESALEWDKMASENPAIAEGLLSHARCERRLATAIRSLKR